MTATHKQQSRRRLDRVNFFLLLVSIASALGAHALITHGVTALILIPSVIAATIAATHLTKREASRD